MGLLADASPSIGVGHVTRVLAVGEELTARRHDVSFLGDCSDSSWVGTEVADLICQSRELTAFDWIVTDSYDADRLAQATTRWKTKKTLAIVDDHSPSTYSDVYVSPGPTFGWQPPPKGSSSHLLSGLEYLLIRKKIRDCLGSEGSERNHVLITAGGTASASTLAPIEVALRSGGWKGRVIALTMDGHPWPGMDPLTEVRKIGPDSLRYARGAQFVITAAGVTSWELVYLRVMLGVVCLSENQRTNYEWMAERGIAVPLGRIDSGDQICDPDRMERLMGTSSRSPLPQGPTPIVDGRGAQRVVAAMERWC